MEIYFPMIKVWVISVLVLVAPVVIRSTKLEASNVAIFYRSDFSESISYGLDVRGNVILDS